LGELRVETVSGGDGVDVFGVQNISREKISVVERYVKSNTFDRG